MANLPIRIHMRLDEDNTPGPVFIALSGKKQVGKDTSAELAVQMLESQGTTVAVTAFAEELKRIAVEVLGVPRDLVYGSNEQKNQLTHLLWQNMSDEIRKNYLFDLGGVMTMPSGPMTAREILQVLGTDVFRNMFDDNVWANAPFNKDWSEFDVVILTDCRFPNERDAIDSRNGHVIRLTRETGYIDEHRSETALDNHTFRYRYDNNGSLLDLSCFIKKTLQEIGIINAT